MDVVIITTPSGAHLEPAVAAATAGKHVVVEKPLEITAERCDRIIDGVRPAPGQALHHLPVAVRRLERRAEGGRRRRAVRPADARRDDLQVVADAGVLRRGRVEGHAGPRRRRGADEPGHPQRRSAAVDDGRRRRTSRGFTATLAHERIEVEDTAVAVLRFASGALGVIQATTSVHPGYPKTIAVHGDRGSAVIEQEDVLRWDFTPETDDDRRVKERFAAKVGASGGAADPKAISHEGHRRQLADFVDAVRTERHAAGGRPRGPQGGGRHPGDLRVEPDRPGGRGPGVKCRPRRISREFHVAFISANARVLGGHGCSRRLAISRLTFLLPCC